MLPELFFVIALAVLGAALFWTTWLLTKMMSQQEKRIVHLLNLAVAKDFQTLSNLSALTTTETGQNEITQPVAYDDVSMARHLAEQYQTQGMDPQYAYDDETDPVFRYFGVSEQ